MIPHDVATQWNLTFDMLDFAVEHITAISTITANCDMKLRKGMLLTPPNFISTNVTITLAL